MIHLIETTSVTRKADFLLVVTDAKGDYEGDIPTWAIGYSPIGVEPHSHREAFGQALKLLAMEEVDPTGCVFEILTSSKMPNGGPPYWKTVRTFGYADALDFQSGAAWLQLLIPADQGEAAQPQGYTQSCGRGCRKPGTPEEAVDYSGLS
jgi:hypothetical protein